MGLFGKEKTSTDYLKEIAKSQKNQEKIAKVAAKENLSQKMEHWANAGKAWSERNIKNAEAEAKRAEIQQMKRNAQLAEEERCKQQLQMFYDSFEFDPNDLNDIERKSMAIISWLDTVDRTFNDKKSKNVDDDNRSKEKTLIKKLTLAVERISFLDKSSAQLDYIARKLEFYKNRQLSEVEAKKNEIAKKRAEAAAHKAKKNKIRNIVVLTLLGAAVVGSLIFAILAIIPNAKKNADDCKDKVVEYINVGKLDDAYTTIVEYEGNSYEDEYEQAYTLLAKELLKNDQLDKTKELKEHISGAYAIVGLIKDYMLQHCMYNDLAKYYSIGVKYAFNEVFEYTELCIKHMCERGQYNDARKFVKRQSIHSPNPQKFIREMNVVIDSYL